MCVHTGGIGDLVLALPALQHLKQQGRLCLACAHQERAELAQFLGLADTICTLDQFDFHSVFAEPSDKLRQAVKQYNKAVVWMKDDDDTIRNALMQYGVGEVCCAPGIPPESWTDHASAWYSHNVGAPGLDAFQVHITKSPNNTIFIQPGSGSPRKNWPLEHYACLSQHILSLDHPVTWMLGPAEESIQAPDGVTVQRNRSLTDVATQLAGARCFIGNDSGLGHIAAAVDCPVLSIFGHTNPTVWAPWNATIVGEEGDWPEYDAVERALFTLLV